MRGTGLEHASPEEIPMHSARHNFRGLRLVAAALLLLTSAGAVAVAYADTTTPTALHQAAAGSKGSVTQHAYMALQALVTRGTINQSQADAVQRQVLAGSVDPKVLVDSGTLSNDRMRLVAGTLEAVKRAG
jgi:hypothetical protein